MSLAHWFPVAQIWVLPGHFLEYVSSNFIVSRLCKKKNSTEKTLQKASILNGRRGKWPYLWKNSSVSNRLQTLEHGHLGRDQVSNTLRVPSPEARWSRQEPPGQHLVVERRPGKSSEMPRTWSPAHRNIDSLVGSRNSTSNSWCW